MNEQTIGGLERVTPTIEVLPAHNEGNAPQRRQPQRRRPKPSVPEPVYNHDGVVDFEGPVLVDVVA